MSPRRNFVSTDGKNNGFWKMAWRNKSVVTVRIGHLFGFVLGRGDESEVEVIVGRNQRRLGREEGSRSLEG